MRMKDFKRKKYHRKGQKEKGWVEDCKGRERATDSFDRSKSLPFFSNFSKLISYERV
jgi:hypothetical protein